MDQLKKDLFWEKMKGPCLQKLQFWLRDGQKSPQLVDQDQHWYPAVHTRGASRDPWVWRLALVTYDR